jgi:hypothetical protein
MHLLCGVVVFVAVLVIFSTTSAWLLPAADAFLLAGLQFIESTVYDYTTKAICLMRLLLVT